VTAVAEDGTGPESEAAADGSQRVPWAARIGVLVVAAVLAGLVFALVHSIRSDDSGRPASALLGRVVPDISGPTLGGGTYDIDDRRNQWVVVNFFASWCIPCRNEHPELVAFDRAHSPVGDASVVSVILNDDPDEVAAFFDENGGDWPVLLDEDSDAVVEFGVTAPPETYLIAPSGVVAAAWIGQVTRQDLEGAIAELSAA
jgi:cytochrome c biogenesis protein CcmG, thiol:disulfide interchange protein DsbE